MRFELLGYQKELTQKIIDRLDSEGKAGLELFTSGGKSFIGMYIIEHYIEKTGKKVLWIAPKSALNNVQKRYINDSEYSEDIECVSINVLSRLRSLLEDSTLYSQYGLIIIDEAHRIMAKKAYIQFQEELCKFDDIKLFAMTASSFRNLDGINSLEQLVGKENVFKYSLNQAIDSGIANPVMYYGTALEYNKKCYQALDILRNKYGNIPYVNSILDYVVEKLKATEKDTATKVVDFISDKVDFTCEKGDRHIVFFSRIAELKEQHDMVRDIMQRVYRDDVVINIIEYHGNLSNKENNEAIGRINAPAQPHVVDVLLTVDKGAESLHPENMRSIILFRSTKSIIKFTQMIGRVITLTEQYNQTNFVFDFCSSINFLGAETITIGHRDLGDRVDCSSDLTPEELLEDALGIKQQTGDNDFIEVNLDETIEELNEVFDRLSMLHVMLQEIEDIKPTLESIKPEVDKDYNGNIARYLYKKNRKVYQTYRKIQNSILFSELNMDDSEALREAMEGIIGKRIYLTARMGEKYEVEVRKVLELAQKFGGEQKFNNLSDYIGKKYFKNLSIELLTDTLPLSMEACIKREEGLYQFLISLFPKMTQEELGCKDPDKFKMGKDLIKKVENCTGRPSYVSWLHWKATVAYIRYVRTKFDEDCSSVEQYSIALSKYLSILNNGIYTYSYRLCDRDNNIGNKVIRLLGYVNTETVGEMLPLDENFAIELMDGKYNGNIYVMQMVDLSNFRTRNMLFDYIKENAPSFKMLANFKKNPTEESLIKLLNYNILRGTPLVAQEAILESTEAKAILKDIGKNGNTQLVRYCVSKLGSDNNILSKIVKRAALNGLEYKGLLPLAFPVEAYDEVKNVVDNLEDTSADNEDMRELKTKYCRMPYATSNLLLSIGDKVIPSRGYKTEKMFISAMQ